MPRSTRIEPSSPDAYRPRRVLLTLRLATLPPAVFLVVFTAIAWSTEPLLALAVVTVVALILLRSLIRRLRADHPVVVDARGLIFGDTGHGDGARLLPWESVTAVVLFDVPRTDTARPQWQPAVGAQLVGHPDGASVYRPLTGWSLDTAALTQAVARFGGGVEVVHGERAGAAPTEAEIHRDVRRAADAAIEAARSQPGFTGTEPEFTGVHPGYADPRSGSRRRIVWHRTARYQPVDPQAYLARHDLRSNVVLILVFALFQVFAWAVVIPQEPGVGIVLAVAFALPLLLLWRSLRGGGAVALAIDQPGVFLGESSSPGDDHDHRLVPWAEIGAVVVYDQLVDQESWQRAVGVRMRGEPTSVRHWRIVSGWTFDRPALETAVARFAPGVPVLDGPPQRPPRPGAVMRALIDTAREIEQENENRPRD